MKFGIAEIKIKQLVEVGQTFTDAEKQSLAGKLKNEFSEVEATTLTDLIERLLKIL